MNIQHQLFINGEFVDAQAGNTIEVLNPYDNSLLAKVAEAREADIDKAVAAAKAAFPAWRDKAAMDRGLLLLKLADAIEADRDNLARLESMDTASNTGLSEPGCTTHCGDLSLLWRYGGQTSGVRCPCGARFS